MLSEIWSFLSFEIIPWLMDRLHCYIFNKFCQKFNFPEKKSWKNWKEEKGFIQENVFHFWELPWPVDLHA